MRLHEARQELNCIKYESKKTKWFKFRKLFLLWIERKHFEKMFTRATDS